MTFKQLSPNSLIIYFKDEITQENSQDVIRVYTAIKASKIDAILDIIPSYSSIVIIFDLFKNSFENLQLQIEELNFSNSLSLENELINIDVYYGLEVGLDLKDMSQRTNLSIDQIIDIHSSKIYDIFAIGFLPGFAYMGNVEDSIKTSRLTTPRKSIPKGSVGIADVQTAIYPQSSPGGWNIVGQSMFKCFDKNIDSLSPFKVGSKVKFNPITKKEFLYQGGNL